MNKLVGPLLTLSLYLNITLLPGEKEPVFYICTLQLRREINLTFLVTGADKNNLARSLIPSNTLHYRF
jgi:hypothetical protein